MMLFIACRPLCDLHQDLSLCLIVEVSDWGQRECRWGGGVGRRNYLYNRIRTLLRGLLFEERWWLTRSLGAVFAMSSRG